jgi:predicted transcriptional regulator
MPTVTADYVLQLKNEYGLFSNYQVSSFLQISNRAVSNWVHRRSTLDDTSSFIISEKLQIDPPL